MSRRGCGRHAVKYCMFLRLRAHLWLLLPIAFLSSCDLADEHPSSASLQKQWRDHRADLETLVTMIKADTALKRVAPDFTRPENLTAAGIDEQRLEEYRRLFKQTGVKNGISGYGKKDTIWFHVSSLGLSVSGSGKGIAFVDGEPEGVVPDLDAHILKAHAGRAESFTAYQRIEGDWYLYYDYAD
jgi:hypothetical protein